MPDPFMLVTAGVVAVLFSIVLYQVMSCVSAHDRWLKNLTTRVGNAGVRMDSFVTIVQQSTVAMNEAADTVEKMNEFIYGAGGIISILSELRKKVDDRPSFDSLKALESRIKIFADQADEQRSRSMIDLQGDVFNNIADYLDEPTKSELRKDIVAAFRTVKAINCETTEEEEDETLDLQSLANEAFKRWLERPDTKYALRGILRGDASD